MVPFSEIAQNELLLTKRGHFRRGWGYGREVLPDLLFSDVRSDRGEWGIRKLSPVHDRKSREIKENDCDLSQKNFSKKKSQKEKIRRVRKNSQKTLKKIRATQRFSQRKKPAAENPAKK
jgi:hypothetical protein